MMHECTNTHKTCLQPPDQFVPRRLLEIPVDRTSLRVRIVETRDISTAQWCALSYCWGGLPKERAVQGDFDNAKREKMIDIKSLPKTILDAILVAYELKIPFLWVDALCILQNDPEDLSQELAAMPKIYKCAILVITACTASSSAEGFLAPRAERVKHDKYVTRIRYHTPRGRSGTILLDLKPAKVYTEPVDSRAWTLQESILACRQVRYESSGIKWFCPSSADATAGINLTQKIRNIQHRSVSTPEDWRVLLSTYCNRKLSHGRDRLLALSAIAADFQERGSKYRYFAGLWTDHLPLNLFWYFNGVGRSRRPTDYRAPSWSWASIDTEKIYRGSSLPDYEIHNLHSLRSFIRHGALHIEEAFTEPADPRLPFGNAKSGRLVFNAPSIRLILRTGRYKFGGAMHLTTYLTKTFHNRSLRILGYTENEIHLDAPEDDFDAWREKGEWEVLMPQAWYFDFSGIHYFLLKRFPSKEEWYQRVGIVQIRIKGYDEHPGPDHLFSLEPDIPDQHFIVV